jgi:hypothetical protein
MVARVRVGGSIDNLPHSEHVDDYQPPLPVKIPPAGDAIRLALRRADNWPRHRGRARAQRRADARRRSRYVAPFAPKDTRPHYNQSTGQLTYPRGVQRFEPYGSMVA